MREAGPRTRAAALGEDGNAVLFGARLKAARKESGLTQRELAKGMAVTAGAVGQWETGGVPASERLGPLAEILGVSLDWLLGRVPSIASPAGTQADPAAELKLLQEARRLGVDVQEIVEEARQRRWLEENRDAITDANAFLDRHGLWSDGKRQF